MPEITVLMSVKNGEKYIKDAIDSVLKQSFTDFELLVMDDNSEDETTHIVQNYKDARIRLEKRNTDFIQNLNEGLSLSRDNYIARMDADDMMHSERLRIQLKRMKKNPEIVVCGTWVKQFSDTCTVKTAIRWGNGIIEKPVQNLLQCNVIVHPSAMINKKFLVENQIRYQDYPCVEDYKLWFDIAKAGGTLFVEPQDLLFYRISESQVTYNRKEEMYKSSIRLRKEILHYLLSQSANPVLSDLLLNMESIERDGLISNEEIFRFYGNILEKMESYSFSESRS